MNLPYQIRSRTFITSGSHCLIRDAPGISEKDENRRKPTKKTIADVIIKAERAVHMVNQLDIFSKNEDIEEVSTSEIRYLLLPALLGYFTDKNVKLDRYDTVQKTQVYYRDFLRLCKNYKVTQTDIPGVKGDGDGGDESAEVKPKVPSHRPDVAELTRQREEKLERYRQQKKTELRLSELRQCVTREHVDDEVQREYYLTLLHKWVGTSIEQLESIEIEMPILIHMRQRNGQEESKDSPTSNVDVPRKKQSQMPFQRPFIVTKDKLQKAIFGAGYPSVPVMSIDEFYDESVAAGDLPPPRNPDSRSMGSGVTRIEGGDASREADDTEEEKKEKEMIEERDDGAALEKARSWDDWKDDHRRGWGNTKNQG